MRILNPFLAAILACTVMAACNFSSEPSTETPQENAAEKTESLASATANDEQKGIVPDLQNPIIASEQDAIADSPDRDPSGPDDSTGSAEPVFVEEDAAEENKEESNAELSSTAVEERGTPEEYTWEGEVAEEEVLTQNASQPAEYTDPQTLLEEAKREFLQSDFGRQLEQKQRRKELYLGWGKAEIAIDPEDPRWGKARTLAYEKALIDAEKQYISYQNVNIQAEKIREICTNTDQEVPDFNREDLEDQTRLERLIEKVLAVGEGKLDQELVELGINPEEFKMAPKPQKHQRMIDAIYKNSLKESIGSLTGLMPLKTFEATNENHEGMILVCVVVSSKNRQFAYDVLHSRGQIKPTENVRESLYDFVTANGNQALINEFGIRKVYDEEGYPCLVAYGQWSNSEMSGDNRLRRRYRDIALKQARSLADSYIAFFLNSSSMYSSISDVGEALDDYDLVYSDNYKERVDAKNILDMMHESATSRASVTLSGIQDLYTWYEEHPEYGHEMVGVVRVWSPRGEIHARNLRDFKPEQKPEAKQVQKSAKVQGTNQVESGRLHNDVDDF